MANAIDNLVRSIATTKIGGKFNLAQFKAIKEQMLQRKAVCERLVAIADEHSVPMSFLVYFALSKEAHRPCNFDKVWQKFNEEKALAIIDMAKAFAAHHGYKKPSDKVYHAMTAYYERCSKDMAVFTSTLAKMEANHKFATTKAILDIMMPTVTVTVEGDGEPTVEVETNVSPISENERKSLFARNIAEVTATVEGV